MIRRPPRSTLFPTTLFRSGAVFEAITSLLATVLSLLERILVDAELSISGLSAKLCRSEEHTSELQSRRDFVCRLLHVKKKKKLNFDVFNHLLTIETTTYYQ